jgi:hypothetical protein
MTPQCRGHLESLILAILVLMVGTGFGIFLDFGVRGAENMTAELANVDRFEITSFKHGLLLTDTADSKCWFFLRGYNYAVEVKYLPGILATGTTYGR